MKTLLTTLLLLISVQFAFTQQDTIVYYKKHVPQATSEGADYQYIVRQKNKKTSVVQKCAFRDGKWKVTQTETIKLKKPNTYYVDGGKYQYQRKFETIAGGYQIQDDIKKGKQSTKGISRSLFPLHREGQWNVYSHGKQRSVNLYKEAVLTYSCLIGKNNERFPTNTYANADTLAMYKEGAKSFSSDLSKKIIYPDICQKNKLEALVLVLFAIDTNGTPSDFQILSETNQYFNQAAIAAVQACNKWKPAFKNGQPVKVYSIVPVNFKLK
ncbi:energy transducer TonB [Labilibaculum sp. K2S]|uniref:energy transducer TonB n=1 Tax=Labilibaculum sp. K2S TaxID=3056386 RepID=UPI0025A3B0D8|nr:energy transducer TonB [Labilibaculum sp. K2S]MDM8161135.1 energy transducer TonB [Labilibaculum sp. K2S]